MIEFKRRDFLYNSGLVNMFLFLYEDCANKKKEENYKILTNIETYPPKIIWNGILISLTHNSLIFECEREKLVEVYKFLIKKYFYTIFEDEEYITNEKVYWEDDLNQIIVKPVIDIKPMFKRIERIKDLQKEFGIEFVSKEKYKEILNKIEEFKLKHPEKKAKTKIMYGSKEKNERIPVFIYRTKDEIIEILLKKLYISKNGNCIICGSEYTKLSDKLLKLSSTNLIYDFGESPVVNRDHRIKNSLPLCFMCNLIYKLGLLLNYYWNNTVFIFDLWSLALLANIKKDLGIKDYYYHRSDAVKVKTNISDKSYFLVRSIYSKFLEMLWNTYLLSMKKKKILEDLMSAQVIMFTVSSEEIENSIFYNNLSYIFQFFKRIEEETLKDFFKHLVGYHYLKEKDKTNLLQEEFIRNILYKKRVENSIMEASYFHFSNFEKNKKSTILSRSKLYLFLKTYYNLIMGNETEYENILALCSAIGKQMGYFAAEVDNKSLIYAIREIGNTEKLAEFFRDFEYEVLKANRGEILNAAEETTNKKYSEIVNEILKLSLNKNLINIMRDLIGIFAIQNYLSTKYAKSMKNKGEKDE